jgi:hypothetical protein
MSHYIPVFFFKMDESRVPEKLDTWQDAMSLLENGLENNRRFGLRESVSRNWWHQNVLNLICRGLQIGGLEFVNSEVTCLRGDDLQAASEALDAVLSSIADGIPNLGQFEHTDIEGLRVPEHRSAIEQAKPSIKVSVDADWGFEAAVGFYSFVKSLREAAHEAIAESQCLLYVQIQP